MELNKSCPICREDIPNNKPLQKAALLSELLEELEVKCRFGVKRRDCITPPSRFGLLGSDYEDNKDGCGAVMQLKDISKHENHCPYNVNLTRQNDEAQQREIYNLKQQLENWKSQTIDLRDQVEQLTNEVETLTESMIYYKDKYEAAKISPDANFNYDLDDVIEFARFLSYSMFTEPPNANWCYGTLHRISVDWRRVQDSHINRGKLSRQVYHLLYTATMCTFWTERQLEKIKEWRNDANPSNLWYDSDD